MTDTINVCAVNPGAFNAYAACAGPDYTAGYYDAAGAYVYPTGPDIPAVVNALAAATVDLQTPAPTPAWVWLAVAAGAWWFISGRGHRRSAALREAVA